MLRSALSFSLTLLLVVTALAAPSNPVVGKWDCRSTDEKGYVATWTLVVNEADGKLSGFVDMGPNERVDILAPKLEGSTFTFAVLINPEEKVEITLKLEGDQLTGKFSGRDSGTGTVTGKRQA